VAKSRRLPLGTPVVPPEEMTTARSPGLARGASGCADWAAASVSSRSVTPGTGPTAATGAVTPSGSRLTVSGKTTTSRGSNWASMRARVWADGGTDRYTAAAPIRCVA
jgi:hypothetical protein